MTWDWNPIFIFMFVLTTVHVVSGSNECVKTKVGRPCNEDSDCHTENELHLYCNKTLKVNVCAFYILTYVGHAGKNIDCEGAEFSAEKWSNPIPKGLIWYGLDCMRMCLHVETCFGVTIANSNCYLKNEKCFSNLKKSPGALIGVLNVVREDYHCGCHYPFTRITSDGKIRTWSPDCPESQKTKNPYRCCSPKGLCIPCTSSSIVSNPINASHPISQLASFDLK